MFLLKSTPVKNIFSFIAMIFILIGIFGITEVGDMDGTIIICPFSGHSMSICKMNPLEHIEEWQSMFTTLPSKGTLSVILSILLTLLALLGLKYFKKLSLENFSRPETWMESFYSRTVPVFNHLQEAFSQGILNPKLF